MEEENTQTQAEFSTPQPQPQKNSLAIPIAIVVGFGLIAAAVYFGGNGKTVNIGASQEDNTPAEATQGKLKPVDENDHIRGNPNAPIMIVEYSDFDCPFCKNFHNTMNRIIDEYGTNGQVAWVYRQFPIEQLHPSAPYVAKASECVAKLAGNEGFWTFADLAFGERTTNEPTNLSRLTEFATTAGADATAFEACLDSDEVESLIEEDYNSALAAGAKGTPHSIITVGGQQGVINGAQPYEVVKQIIDNLITQMEGGEVGES